MAASCQSVNSMFELRPIRTCEKFESVKELEIEMPSVKLIARLVEVQLKEFGFYVIVRVRYVFLALLTAMCIQGRTFLTFFLPSVTMA